MWKEAVVACLKALSRHIRGEIKKTLSQDSRSPGRRLSPGPPEYKAGVPITRLQCSSMSTIKYELDNFYEIKKVRSYRVVRETHDPKNFRCHTKKHTHTHTQI
jgi:hypothetical protein